MDYWLCVSVCLCVSVFSRERHNVQMLRASLSEKSGYKELVGAMSAASDQLCLKHERSSFSAQPGWNDHVYDSHKAARDSFVIWHGIGKA